MLDSLVRVSRRVVWNHFVNILSISVEDPSDLFGIQSSQLADCFDTSKGEKTPKNAADLNLTQGIPSVYNTQRATFQKGFTPN